MRSLLVFFGFVLSFVLMAIGFKPVDSDIRDFMQEKMVQRQTGLANISLSPVGDIAFNYFYTITDVGILKVVVNNQTGKQEAMAMFNTIWLVDNEQQITSEYKTQQQKTELEFEP